ncbi:MAG: DUF4381 domain-containing protein [Ectothiorhodospiraceae bacterium]|nr:DUF4381 domain-containing protein [Ectothiorhodospiraceae bacterium]
MNPEIPLRDIHLPEAIGWWPLALGWWLLIALLILIPLIIWGAKRYIARQQLRKQALANLSAIETNFKQHQNDQQLVSEVSILLRRICISHFPRADVAGLSGEAWTQFLNSRSHSSPRSQKPHSPVIHFDDESCFALMTGPYQQQQCDINSQKLLDACRGWIKHLKPLSKPLAKPQSKPQTPKAFGSPQA